MKPNNRGEPYVHVPNAPFLHICIWPARPAAGRFSRSRLRGTQGGRVYTTAQFWVPAGLRGSRSGLSKSRDLTSTHRIASAELEPTRPMETCKHNIVFILHLSLLLFSEPSQQPSKATRRQPRCNSHVSSLSLCDSHERCFCMCVRERACVRVIIDFVILSSLAGSIGTSLASQSSHLNNAFSCYLPASFFSFFIPFEKSLLFPLFFLSWTL